MRVRSGGLPSGRPFASSLSQNWELPPHPIYIYPSEGSGVDHGSCKDKKPAPDQGNPGNSWGGGWAGVGVGEAGMSPLEPPISLLCPGADPPAFVFHLLINSWLQSGHVQITVQTVVFIFNHHHSDFLLNSDCGFPESSAQRSFPLHEHSSEKQGLQRLCSSPLPGTGRGHGGHELCQSWDGSQPGLFLGSVWPHAPGYPCICLTPYSNASTGIGQVRVHTLVLWVPSLLSQATSPEPQILHQ